ncbi:MAG: hypothetical protein JWL80_566 [Parcubacteria group bacterium]|nr:hypothetical protein [Parcubacteria group bacterium]
MKKVFFGFVFLLFFVLSSHHVFAASAIYRSVASGKSSALTIGGSNALTVSGSVATFASPLPTNIGVGDALVFASASATDTIAFISGRTSSTVYSLVTASGASLSTTTSSMQNWAIYRAYTSLQNVVSGIENTGITSGLRNFDTFTTGLNLVTADQQWNIALYGNGTSGDVDIVDFGTRQLSTPWVTDATRNIRLFSPGLSTEVGVSQRPNGVWDDTKYHVTSNNYFGTLLLPDRIFITIDGIQIENNRNQIGGGEQGDAIWTAVNATTDASVVITNSVLKKTGTAVDASNAGVVFNTSSAPPVYVVKIVNNVIYGFFVNIKMESFSGKAYIYNNTLVAGPSSSKGLYVEGYATTSAGAYWIKNNLSTGHPAGDYDYNSFGSATVVRTNNLSSDSTSNGTNPKTLKTVLFVSTSTPNYHLLGTDISAKDQGASLAADAVFPFTTDIDGETRSGTWDIGADEFLDIVAPTTPTGLTATPASPTLINLAWASSTDAVGVSYYNIYRCTGGACTPTVSIATTTSIFYANSGLATSTVYGYAVSAFDAAGNESSLSSTVATTTPASDTVAPAISAGSPSGTFTSTTTAVTLAVTTDENATCKYGTVAGTAYASIASTFSTTGGTAHSQSLTGLTPAVYTYYVRCRDAFSNANLSDYTISFTILSADVTPPSITLTSPAASSTVYGISTFTISATSSDNIGVVGIEFFLDNTSIGFHGGANMASSSQSLNTSTTSDGIHTLKAVARDAAGNFATSSAISVTVNNAPSAPGNFMATGVSPTFIDLLWDQSTSPIGSALHYNLYRNSVLATTTIASRYWYTDKLLASSTTYTYQVVAIDAQGRTSATSTDTGTTDPIQNTEYVPELPRVLINSAATSTPVTGVTWNATTTAALYYILPRASLGDEIILTAGQTYSGPFVLPKITTGSGWLTIRTSDMAGLETEGNRVSSTSASHMAKIITTDTGPAIQTVAQTHNIRMIGIEVASAVSTGFVADEFNYNGQLIDTGGSRDIFGNPSGILGDLPHDLIFDRMYIHGNDADSDRRGISMNSATTTVVDSYISNFKTCGFDAQAINGLNSFGPYKIVNNFLEASGENLNFGGGDPAILGAVPSDIEFRHNYLYKPASWRTDATYCALSRSDGQPWWNVKNLFELKTAQRMLIDGNILDGNWNANQDGTGVNIKGNNQQDSGGAGATTTIVANITFTNNIIRNVGAILKIPSDSGDGENLMIPAQKMLFANNLGYNVNTPPYIGDKGSALTLFDSQTDMTFKHNTFIATTSGFAIEPAGMPDSNTRINDNLIAGATYGVKAPGLTEGTQSVGVFTGSGTFLNNLIQSTNNASYPATNVALASISSVNFVNLAGQDFRLASNSPGHNTASDGTDIGVNMTTLNAKTAGVLTGDFAPPVVSGGSPAGVISTTTSATLTVVTDENATCKYGTVPGTAYASIASTFSSTGGTSHSQGLTGLSVGAHSYYVRCSDINSFVNPTDYTISFTIGSGGDVTPPTVSMTAPTNGATVSGSSVAVSATASDNTSVIGVQFKLDGTNLGTEDTSSAYGITWNTTSATDGSHSLVAVARDGAGNYATSTAVTVTVSNGAGDTTPPVISGVSPSGTLTAGVASVSVHVTTNENATCRYSTSAGTPYISMSGLFIFTGSTSHSFGANFLQASTTYTYYIRCVDQLGNANLSDEIVTFTLPPFTAGGNGALTLSISGKRRTSSSASSPSPVTPQNTSLSAQQILLIQNNRSLILQAQLLGIVVPQSLLDVLASVPVSTGRDLEIGAKGNDVYDLQKLLATLNAGPAARALVKNGITHYFGPLTKTALAEFQVKYGITPPVGYYGPKTQTFIQSNIR